MGYFMMLSESETALDGGMTNELHRIWKEAAAA
jgi:hypothetical protein